jgi:hypothetical protein
MAKGKEGDIHARNAAERQAQYDFIDHKRASDKGRGLDERASSNARRQESKYGLKRK